MEFCPKCGAVLIQKLKNSVCPRCSYSAKGKLKISISEEIKEKNKEIVVFKGQQESVHPMVNETCKKCDHSKAYFWTVQTRASDEAETKFFKCVKCDHTWREYR